MVFRLLLRRTVLVEPDRLAVVLCGRIINWIQGLLLFGVIEVIQITIAGSLVLVERLEEDTENRENRD